MTLAIVGSGLVSPVGRTTREHAFFVRAFVPAPPPSPFFTADDEQLYVDYCPWIGAAAPIVERLLSMASVALEEAMLPLTDWLGADVRCPLIVCQSRARPGLGEDEQRAVEQALARSTRATSIDRAFGDAGVFSALGQAESLLESGEGTAVIIVALDSFIDVEALRAHVERPRSPWAEERISPSEACAALIVTRRESARASAIRILGAVIDSAVTLGAARDDNDELVDGAGLTSAVRALRPDRPIHLAFGQAAVDGLRAREWSLCAARIADSHLDPECSFVTFEEAVGGIGAASGAASIVYALSQFRHRIIRKKAALHAPFLAWAISPDGTRGVARLAATT